MTDDNAKLALVILECVLALVVVSLIACCFSPAFHKLSKVADYLVERVITVLSILSLFAIGWLAVHLLLKIK